MDPWMHAITCGSSNLEPSSALMNGHGPGNQKFRIHPIGHRHIRTDSDAGWGAWERGCMPVASPGMAWHGAGTIRTSPQAANHHIPH